MVIKSVLMTSEDIHSTFTDTYLQSLVSFYCILILCKEREIITSTAFFIKGVL